jgi:predicted 3-demethylubiquinone-9 3-methyltransferase (glyoxalase superfamily)
MNGGPEYKFTPAVSFMIPCETQQEVDATGTSCWPMAANPRPAAGSPTSSASPGR